MAQPHDGSHGQEPKCYGKGCLCCTGPEHFPKQTNEKPTKPQ